MIVDRLWTRLYAFGWIVVFVLLYTVLRDLVPEQFLRDAESITEIMGGNYSTSQSFYNTAMLYAMMPVSILHGFMLFVGGISIWLLGNQAVTVPRMIWFTFLIVPLIFQSFIAPTKEVLVVLMSLIIYWYACREKSGIKGTLFLAVILYAAYALLVREYFLLILLAMLGLYFCKSHPRLRWPVIALAIAIVAMMPAQLFMELQGPRDKIAEYLAFYSMNVIRTYFFNPFVPENFLNFVGNYFYALGVMNIPFFIDLTWKELVLFINTTTWFSMVYLGWRHLTGPMQVLPVILLGHLVVLPLFEPDLGSYLRHASSASIYMVPVFIWLTQRLREKQLSEQHAAPASIIR
jgi:hypothetical protein